MTPEDVTALVATLPEAEIGSHSGMVAFKVGKKLFATLTQDGVVRLAVPAEAYRDMLLAEHPEVFEAVPRYASQGVIGVRVAAVEPALLRELLTNSWATVAPKRAQSALAERLKG